MDDIKKIIDFDSVKALTIECSNGAKYVLKIRDSNIYFLKKVSFHSKYQNIYCKAAKKYSELNDKVKIYDILDEFLNEVTREVLRKCGLIYKEVKP